METKGFFQFEIVYRRQILMSKVDHRTERVEVGKQYLQLYNLT